MQGYYPFIHESVELRWWNWILYCSNESSVGCCVHVYNAGVFRPHTGIHEHLTRGRRTRLTPLFIRCCSSRPKRLAVHAAAPDSLCAGLPVEYRINQLAASGCYVLDGFAEGRTDKL